MQLWGISMITADTLKSLLNLRPHPEEGGYFRETYRSLHTLSKDILPGGYEAERSLATAIYFLLTPDTFSALHRLPTDEIFHFYLGDPVEMLQLLPDGSGRTITLGSAITSGMQLQVVVKKGVWQGSRLCAGGQFALLGTSMSPGFESSDYESGERERLIAAYPQFENLITVLTR